MQRVAFLMGVKPGHEREYKERHAAVWPELLKDLSAAGARNYSIYMDGTRLFAYMEVEDFEAFNRAMAASDANRRWQAFMAPIMDVRRDPKTGHPVTLEEVFHLE